MLKVMPLSAGEKGKVRALPSLTTSCEVTEAWGGCGLQRRDRVP